MRVIEPFNSHCGDPQMFPEVKVSPFLEDLIHHESGNLDTCRAEQAAMLAAAMASAMNSASAPASLSNFTRMS